MCLVPSQQLGCTWVPPRLMGSCHGRPREETRLVPSQQLGSCHGRPREEKMPLLPSQLRLREETCLMFSARHLLSQTSSQLPTPQREAYFSVFLSNKKYESALTKIFEPHPLVFTTPTPTVQPTPTLSHPFHHYRPSKYGGRHRSIGKNVYSFNLQRASDAAAYYERDKIIKLYHTTGNPEQRKHTLKLFLSEKTNHCRYQVHHWGSPFGQRSCCGNTTPEINEEDFKEDILM